MPERIGRTATPMPSIQVLGRLLQFGSANLPVGAFSYSEGLETLVQQGLLSSSGELQQWLSEQLDFGPIRVEAALLWRMHAAAVAQQEEVLAYWDAWLAASRESEELLLQNRQMARALWRLLRELTDAEPRIGKLAPSQYATAFAVSSAWAGIPVAEAVLTYVHSWLANLIVSGVRLIPLGQSAGQKLLWEMQDALEVLLDFAQNADESELYAWNCGVALASMQHEDLYSRLYRS